MLRKKAFTLTELLIALTIVGALAALSIPTMVENINQKLLTTQLKNTIVTVQQIASEELINNQKRDLSETAFASPQDVYKMFNSSNPCNDQNPCWGPENDSSYSYKSINNTNLIIQSPEDGIKIKNGVSLNYKLYSPAPTNFDQPYGSFTVDLNGKDKPNIVGRDYFIFYVTKSGKIYQSTTFSDSIIILLCKAGIANYCTQAIQISNWKMTY